MKDIVLFLQNRATRAGAQTSLARLIVGEALRPLSPVALIGDPGWLANWCNAHQIPALIETFPRSRAIPARLWGNHRFAIRIKAQLGSMGMRPVAVVANDHQDGLLANAIANVCDARPVVILRTPGMSQRDFLKYGCGRADIVYAVGDELQVLVRQMDTGQPVLPYHEGLADDEFLPPKDKPGEFPAQVLVAGSEVARKGWADWVMALDRLEAADENFRLDCDFTGTRPDPSRNDCQLGRARRSQFRFLGRVEGFRELVRNYDLVIHPSRHESFGLAPIEVLAAGVPLLSSRAGAIAQVQADKNWLFEPGNINDLADTLGTLRTQWRSIDPSLGELQQRIRSRFSASQMAQSFTDRIGQMIA